jgi:hypothetical protein
MAGNAVAAAANAYEEVDFDGPPDGRHDVGHVRRAEDAGGLAGGQSVVGGTGCLVPAILRLQHLSPRAGSQIIHDVHSDLRSQRLTWRGG